MNALDFLDTAIRLSASQRESDCRSAVSRAYYGVFHVTISFVEIAGISLPATGSVHEKLAWLLHAGNCSEIVQAGSILEILRKERNRADYDLNDARFRDSQNVRRTLLLAQEFVAVIAICEAEPIRSQIHAHMRAYAKNTLRLIVAERGESEA